MIITNISIVIIIIFILLLLSGKPPLLLRSATKVLKFYKIKTQPSWLVIFPEASYGWNSNDHDIKLAAKSYECT